MSALLRRLHHGRGPAPTSLDDFLKDGEEPWRKLAGLARKEMAFIDDESLDTILRRGEDGHAGYCCGILLAGATCEPERREALVKRCLALLERQPSQVLRAAGYHLHEHNRLLDRRWLDAARKHAAIESDGAGGVFASTAMYRDNLLTDNDVAWVEGGAPLPPEDRATVLLSLAMHRPALASRLVPQVLAMLPAHPAKVVSSIALVASDSAPLHEPELLHAVLRHLDAEPEKAWDFLYRACQASPGRFDDAMLDAVEAAATTAPGRYPNMLAHLMSVEPTRAIALHGRYVAMLRRHPGQVIKQAYYDFQGDSVALVRQEMVDALTELLPADAYPGYQFLMHCIDRRPELLHERGIEASVAAIPQATNYAFGFFRQLLEKRPEFTRQCTLALFECLALEPVNRAQTRVEEMHTLIAISEAAYIRTGLENALREPPRVGSRRARALMAIMFRQKLRARRHVLLEALRYAAERTMWREHPDEDLHHFSPVWDFLFFIIDHSGDDAISTAAAEQFLEGAFQLSHLYANGVEHEVFLRRLDTMALADVALPVGTGFLAADQALVDLYKLVIGLGQRFSFTPKLAPLTTFANREQTARNELRAIDTALEKAPEAKRRSLGERRKALEQRCGWWADPVYRRACDDIAAASELAEDARAFLMKERKDLTKELRDALRAEAVRMGVAAVDQSRLDLYRARLRDILGRDVELNEVASEILPAFLWFPAIARLPNNTACLRRLIEDRLAERSHDWLRTEEAALDWAKRVQAEQPEAKLDRWRAPFTRQFDYRAKASAAEKRRRIAADLEQTRELLIRAGADVPAGADYTRLAAALAALREPPKREKDDEKDAKTPPTPPPDPVLLDEIGTNLERIRIAEQTPESDYTGRLDLMVETDPFAMLFMGEYGFASCLSLRGINAWSAVSNAIDIDKVIVWAKEPGGNVVGRRLLALLPEGLLSFRTYTNRNGLALDDLFERFVAEYASHCGVPVIHRGHPKPLLSDHWYDDGAI